MFKFHTRFFLFLKQWTSLDPKASHSLLHQCYLKKEWAIRSEYRKSYQTERMTQHISPCEGRAPGNELASWDAHSFVSVKIIERPPLYQHIKEIRYFYPKCYSTVFLAALRNLVEILTIKKKLCLEQTSTNKNLISKIEHPIMQQIDELYWHQN